MLSAGPGSYMGDPQGSSSMENAITFCFEMGGGGGIQCELAIATV